MSNKAARLWIEALKSGTYKQTKHALQRVLPNSVDPVGFCCLGVACDLYEKDTGNIISKTENDLVVYDSYRGLLPQVVINWLGLSFDTHDKRPSLIELNDTGSSFSDIADVLVNNYTKFFTH